MGPIIVTGVRDRHLVLCAGGYIGNVLNFTQDLTNTLFGMVLAGLVIYLAVIICTRFGIDLWVYQKAVYGYKLYILIFILSIGSTWGYEGDQL